MPHPLRVGRSLEQFRAHYSDPSITKWDILHYIYAVLHHPEYRQRYAANLRRELPRIPFVSASGAKAQIKDDADAALKRRSSTVTSSRSSTVTSSRSSTVTSSNDGVRVGASVEERPFRAASEQEDSRALAPVPSDLDVFHAFVSASPKSMYITSSNPNTR